MSEHMWKVVTSCGMRGNLRAHHASWPHELVKQIAGMTGWTEQDRACILRGTYSRNEGGFITFKPKTKAGKDWRKGWITLVPYLFDAATGERSFDEKCRWAA